MVPFDVMADRNSMVYSSRGVTDLCKSFEMLVISLEFEGIFWNSPITDANSSGAELPNAINVAPATSD